MTSFDIPLSLFSAEELEGLDRAMGCINAERLEHEDNPPNATVVEGVKYALARLLESEEETAVALRLLRERDAEYAELKKQYDGLKSWADIAKSYLGMDED